MWDYATVVDRRSLQGDMTQTTIIGKIKENVRGVVHAGLSTWLWVIFMPLVNFAQSVESKVRVTRGKSVSGLENGAARCSKENG